MSLESNQLKRDGEMHNKLNSLGKRIGMDDVIPPEAALASRAAFSEWLESLTDSEFVRAYGQALREQARQLSDEDLLAELAKARQETKLN